MDEQQEVDGTRQEVGLERTILHDISNKVVS